MKNEFKNKDSCFGYFKNTFPVHIYNDNIFLIFTNAKDSQKS